MGFEIFHRYLNWLALCLLITHITLVTIHQAPTIQEALQGTPCIFAIFLVILTVYPWVILHRIKGRDMEIVPANQSTAFIFPWWAPMGAVCKLSTDFVEFHVMGSEGPREQLPQIFGGYFGSDPQCGVV